MADGKRAGWYPDPSGLTKKFRWWDGERWTVAVADTLWANEPTDAQPYAPPPPGRHAADVPPSGPSLPTIVEVEDLYDGSRRRRWIIGVMAAVVVLGAAATATAIWLSQNGGTTPVAGRTSPAATSASTTSTPSPSPSPTTESPSPSPTPSATTPAVTPAGGHLAFSPPNPQWRAATGPVLRQDLGNQQAMFLNTEELWDGKHNWTALIVAGDLPAGAKATGGLPARTVAVARWYLRTEWNSPPSAGPGNGKSLFLGGHPAYRIRTQVAYNFKGLKSKHDNIDIVLIDYGPDRANGLLIASIPETHPQLSKDVDTAINSLRLETTS
ncbi:DUF2510 domain-containing protein [Flindersiella endophytica]